MILIIGWMPVIRLSLVRNLPTSLPRPGGASPAAKWTVRESYDCLTGGALRRGLGHCICGPIDTILGGRFHDEQA